MTEEGKIKREICEYLEARGIFFWLNVVPDKRNYQSRYKMNGVPDILGIYKERLLAIEVKRPGGKLSSDQVAFINRASKSGAVVITAFRVDDVIEMLGNGK